MGAHFAHPAVRRRRGSDGVLLREHADHGGFLEPAGAGGTHHGAGRGRAAERGVRAIADRLSREPGGAARLLRIHSRGRPAAGGGAAAARRRLSRGGGALLRRRSARLFQRTLRETAMTFISTRLKSAAFASLVLGVHAAAAPADEAPANSARI